jgi:hypothetical protein
VFERRSEWDELLLLEDALTKLRTLRLHASTLALCLVVFPLLARLRMATGTAALVGEVTDSQKQVIPAPR